MHLPIAAPPEFQTGQIIYLEHEGDRLYAEAIQVVSPRQLCWARPLALVKSDFTLHDLRQGSDLLLPLSLFFIALDTEVIPVITQLNTPKINLETREENLEVNHHKAHLILQDFIRQIWQAHPQQFST
jgi:hypothetical protein